MHNEHPSGRDNRSNADRERQRSGGAADRIQPEVRRHPLESDIHTGVTFLTALFAASDTILFRPIETWTEGGKKRSRTNSRNTCYRQARPESLQFTLRELHQVADANRLNLFFSVCPRFGDKGQYDLAWQIRTVRALWTDIDHVAVEEALERISRSGLPTPSIVVNSGNGVHVYWLLSEPYLIDDTDDPPAVHTEWVDKANGGKTARKYILEGGEKVWLATRRSVTALSSKAQRLQDVLSGVAKACGGDHTTDLSRLLRVPGSLNRKDQRNGRAPLPTQLVTCVANLRHAFGAFERFSLPSEESERAKKIAMMPLPKIRKLAAQQEDRLAELVAACGIAPAGQRSEADFSLCCFAVKKGVDKELVWPQVESIGKFAEQGRRYFDLTWQSAEHDVRVGTYQKLRAKHESDGDRDIADLDVGGSATEHAFDDSPGPNEPRPIIRINPATTMVGDTLSRITDCLVRAGNCHTRCEQLVVIYGESIRAVLTPAEFAGLLNQHVEFFYIDDKKGEYRPLTPAYSSTWLNQRVERSRIPEIRMFTRNPVFTQDWRLVTPGYDLATGIYYAGEPIASRAGTDRLDELLHDFCFKRPADRTNYIAMLLTIVLMPHFIGAKPACLFNGNQPGLGKSILAQGIAILRDGHPTDTASYNANDEEFEKRLGAIVRQGATTIIIDNAKCQGRKARIESACLERSITDAVLSFRLLGKSQEIRAENSHIFGITANTPNVSPDLISRSVVINLEYEGDPKRRKFPVTDPESYVGQHRAELLGELIGMVERWLAAGKPMARVNTRFNKRGWGDIIGGILEHDGQPDFLANAEEAAAQLDETRRDFEDLVALLVDHPQGNWTATELAELCGREGLLTADLGEGTPRSLATKMGALAGRYIDERFGIPDDRQVVFRRSLERKGNIYRVVVVENAEP